MFGNQVEEPLRNPGSFSRGWSRAIATSRTLLWAVVGAGVVLRIVRYLDNRSLWLDESFLALNLIGKTAEQLTGQLDYLQAAPTGFLLLEKLVVETVGDSEYALRLLPLVAGVASLFLFWAVARRILAPGALLLATLLIAVNEPLIYYSSEVKPYGTDVAVALVLVLLACRFVEGDGRQELPRTLLLVIAGITAVWVSFTAIFVLAAIATVLLVRAVSTGNRREMAASLLLGLVWLASFLALFVVASQNTSRISDAIFGEPHAASESWPWMWVSRLADDVHAGWGLVVDPVGFERGTNGLAALMLAVGVFALARHRDELERGAVVALPIVAAFCAALVDRYPLGGRFSLFLVPFAVIIVARGVQEVAGLARGSLILAVSIAAVLTLPPTVDAVSNALDPPRSQHVRPILRYVDENARNGDILFVHRRAQYALRYYGECDDCRPWSGDFPWPLRPAAAPPGQYQPALESVPPLMLVQSTSEGDRILDNFREVDGLPRDRRIWFLFTHPETRRGLDEEQMFLSYLDLNGRRLDERIGEDASLYLYTLNRRYG